MMRELRVVGLALALGACAGEGSGTGEAAAGAASAATADPAAVRTLIDSANVKTLTSLNAGSVDGMVANYADDAIVMMSGMKAMTGKAAIEGTMKGMFDSMALKNFKSTTSDVMVSGDIAVETGVLMYDSGPKGGKLTTDTAKYLTVWKKQGDGSWKIVRDINNTDIAPKM